MKIESKKSKETTIIIIIFMAVIILLGGFIIHDKFINSRTDSPTSNLGNIESQIKSHKSGNLYKNANDNDVICSTNSSTPYLKGTKYICNNLGDGKSYTFYVLNDATNSDKVDLIMNEDYITSTYFELTADGSIDWDGTNNSANGPVKAIKSLPTIETWSNLESPKDNSGYDYSQFAARLPMANEIATACEISNFDEMVNKNYELKTKDNCSFLWENTQNVDSNYKYSGYLTSTYLKDSYLSWIVYSTNMTKQEYDDHVGSYSEIQLYDNVLLMPVYAGSVFGVRPVICLSK